MVSAPLPKYSGGANESFERFFLTFEAIVINPLNYSSCEKYLVLKECCTATAFSIVDSLEVTNQSYEQAKALLETALASPVNRKFDTLQRWQDIELTTGSCPYKFVGEIKSLLELVQSTNLFLDDVCQFFIWRALNKEMKDHLINITNSNKPELAEIMDNIFSAIERCKSNTEHEQDKVVSKR